MLLLLVHGLFLLVNPTNSINIHWSILKSKSLWGGLCNHNPLQSWFS